MDIQSKIFQLRMKHYNMRGKIFLSKFYSEKEIKKFIGKPRWYLSNGIPLFGQKIGFEGLSKGYNDLVYSRHAFRT